MWSIDRVDAGHTLAERLETLAGNDAVVVGLPRGWGRPVGQSSNKSMASLIVWAAGHVPGRGALEIEVGRRPPQYRPLVRSGCLRGARRLISSVSAIWSSL